VSFTSGQTTGTFPVTTQAVSSAVAATITASSGSQNLKTPLEVNPFQVLSLTLNPTKVPGGTSVTGTVTVNATVGAGSPSITVSLARSTRMISVPATISVSAGNSASNFTIVTTPVQDVVYAKVSGTLNGSNGSATATIEPPQLVQVICAPNPIHGGSSTPIKATVTLGSPAPAGFVVPITSGSPGYLSVKSNASFAAGSKTAFGTLMSHPVPQDSTVSVSASYGIEKTIRTTEKLY
jgi:hypothetical protein